MKSLQNHRFPPQNNKKQQLLSPPKKPPHHLTVDTRASKSTLQISPVFKFTEASTAGPTPLPSAAISQNPSLIHRPHLRHPPAVQNTARTQQTIIHPTDHHFSTITSARARNHILQSNQSSISSSDDEGHAIDAQEFARNMDKHRRRDIRVKRMQRSRSEMNISVRPKLLKVEIMSTDYLGYGPNVAVPPDDVIIIKIVSDVAILQPKLKLWPRVVKFHLSPFLVGLGNVEVVAIVVVPPKCCCALPKDHVAHAFL